MSLTLLMCLWISPGLAQSRPTMKRVERLMDQGAATPKELRAAFKAISDELRSQPDEATPEGWWLRGTLATTLAQTDERPTTMATVALDSFDQALRAGAEDVDLAPLDTLDALLLPLTTITADRSPEVAYDAVLVLLISEDLRKRLHAAGVSPPPDPLGHVRLLDLGARTSLANGNTRAASKMFTELSELGGFDEAIALELAAALEEKQGPQAAYVFYAGILPKHPGRKRLLNEYVDLCLKNGWRDEASKGTDQLAALLGSSYDEQLRLAQLFHAVDRPTESRRHLERALSKTPKGFEANVLLATLELANRVPDDVERDQAVCRKALEPLQRALGSNPDNLDVLQKLAEVYTALEDEAALAEVQARLQALQAP